MKPSRAARSRAAVPTMLSWSTALGGLGVLGSGAVAGLTGGNPEKALVGGAAAVVVVTLGVVAVSTMLEAGPMTVVLVMGLYLVQVLALLALLHRVQGVDWFRSTELAAAAAASVLCWQLGITIGYLRARTPLELAPRSMP